MGKLPLVDPSGLFRVALRWTERFVELRIPVESAVLLAVAPGVAEIAVRFRRHQKTSQRERDTFFCQTSKFVVRFLHHLGFPIRKARPPFEENDLAVPGGGVRRFEKRRDLFLAGASVEMAEPLDHRAVGELQ